MTEDPYLQFMEENTGELTGTVTALENKRVVVSLTDAISGSVRDVEFDQNSMPAVGDTLQVYIASQERKGFLINLTLNPDNSSAEKAAVKKHMANNQPTRATFGDLIKDKDG